MIKLGLIDLCTSHCEAWLPLLREMEGVEVTAVADTGGCRPPDFVKEYAEKFGIPHVCADAEEVAELTDAGIVWSANWGFHLPHARPYLERGKPVFIDKPAVGNLRELNELLYLQARHGSLVMTGSSCRYAYEVQELIARREEIGEVITVWAQGPGDFFSYGIHTVEMFQGYLGPGARFVRHVGAQGDTDVFLCQYTEGPAVFYQLGSPHRTWRLLLNSASGLHEATLDPSRIYQALIEKFVAAIREGTPPWPLEAQLECIKIALAARIARREGGDIYLSDLPEAEYFDAGPFWAEYARMRQCGK
ncbi:MAG TPA: Gfo/Idh/MocA family oxidoreductase [Armatimonadota bacterium]|jgi:predicted dehydrogenase